MKKIITLFLFILLVSLAKAGPIENPITASTGPNGSIFPSGTVGVAIGADQTFTITPYTCNLVLDVLVDGTSVGAVSTYTFYNVTSSHTISVTFIHVADGTSCDDGNACTQTDVCLTGICTGTNPIICTAQDQCHTAGICDPLTGICSNPLAAHGTSCNDGNACTQTDICDAGLCIGTNPVICTASDQCHDAGICNPATGICTNPQKANGTACNDANACTQTDVCQAGECTGINPVVCNAPDQCHTAGTCDPSTGICSYPQKVEGTSCNDGNACTQTDICAAGTCVGFNQIVCTAQDQCHTAGTCDPTTGTCSNPLAANGTSCNDGNACTQTDVCQTGACVGTNPVICTAQDQCHTAGTCDPVTGICSNPQKANGSSCDDGNACTQTDICQAGACTGINPVICTASDQCHIAGVCNPATGICSNPQKANGSSCDDGNACTSPDVCQAGECVVTNHPPIISSQSTATQTQCKNGIFSAITVSAYNSLNGTGIGLSYQWFYNASNSNSGGLTLGTSNGANTNSYTPQSATAGTLYYYSVVSGTCGTATSAVSGAFIVNSQPTPVITGPDVVNAGETHQYCTTLVAGHAYYWSGFGEVSFPNPNAMNCINDHFYSSCGYIPWVITVTETVPSTACSTTTTMNIIIH